MLSYLVRVLLVVLLAVTVAGCSVVGGIFKAGFWVGIVIAAVIVIGIFALLRRGGSSRSRYRETRNAATRERWKSASAAAIVFAGPVILT